MPPLVAGATFVVGLAVTVAPAGVGDVDGTAEDSSSATAGAGGLSGRMPDGVALPDRARPAVEVGGGQPSSEGESISAATANTSSAAATSHSDDARTPSPVSAGGERRRGHLVGWMRCPAHPGTLRSGLWVPQARHDIDAPA